MKKTLIYVLAAMTIATAYGRTFDAEDGFSITLPDGWVQIPGVVVQHFGKQLNDRNPTLPPVVFDYGYQLQTTGEPSSAPYILVQFKHVAPMSMDKLGDTESLVSYMNHAFAKSLENFTGKFSGATVEPPIYDATHDIFWTTMSMERAGVGRGEALIGIKRTRNGFIQLSGYASADSFGDYEQCFRDAFANLVIGDSTRYATPFPAGAKRTSYAHARAGWVYLQAAVIGGIMWLLKSFIVRGARAVVRVRMDQEDSRLGSKRALHSS